MVGRTIVLSGVPHVVVGVLPAGTPYIDWGDVYRPLVRTADPQRDSWELLGIGRLAPGATPDAALADLKRVMHALAERHPDVNAGMSGGIGTLGAST